MSGKTWVFCPLKPRSNSCRTKTGVGISIKPKPQRKNPADSGLPIKQASWRWALMTSWHWRRVKHGCYFNRQLHRYRSSRSWKHLVLMVCFNAGATGSKQHSGHWSDHLCRVFGEFCRVCWFLVGADRQLTTLMTSVFLCTVFCRERDVAWVRSINHASELCIITALSRTGAWYRNALYELPEVWPISVLTSPIRLRRTYTWLSAYGRWIRWTK